MQEERDYRGAACVLLWCDDSWPLHTEQPLGGGLRIDGPSADQKCVEQEPFDFARGS